MSAFEKTTSPAGAAVSTPGISGASRRSWPGRRASAAGSCAFASGAGLALADGIANPLGPRLGIVGSGGTMVAGVGGAWATLAGGLVVGGAGLAGLGVAGVGSAAGGCCGAGAGVSAGGEGVGNSFGWVVVVRWSGPDSRKCSGSGGFSGTGTGGVGGGAGSGLGGGGLGFSGGAIALGAGGSATSVIGIAVVVGTRGWR